VGLLGVSGTKYTPEAWQVKEELRTECVVVQQPTMSAVGTLCTSSGEHKTPRVLSLPRRGKLIKGAGRAGEFVSDVLKPRCSTKHWYFE